MFLVSGLLFCIHVNVNVNTGTCHKHMVDVLDLIIMLSKANYCKGLLNSVWFQSFIDFNMLKYKINLNSVTCRYQLPTHSACTRLNCQKVLHLYEWLYSVGLYRPIHSAVPCKNAVSANIKHSRYFLSTSIFWSIHYCGTRLYVYGWYGTSCL